MWLGETVGRASRVGKGPEVARLTAAAAARRGRHGSVANVSRVSRGREALVARRCLVARRWSRGAWMVLRWTLLSWFARPVGVAASPLIMTRRRDSLSQMCTARARMSICVSCPYPERGAPESERSLVCSRLSPRRCLWCRGTYLRTRGRNELKWAVFEGESGESGNLLTTDPHLVE